MTSNEERKDKEEVKKEERKYKRQAIHLKNLTATVFYPEYIMEHEKDGEKYYGIYGQRGHKNSVIWLNNLEEVNQFVPHLGEKIIIYVGHARKGHKIKILQSGSISAEELDYNIRTAFYIANRIKQIYDIDKESFQKVATALFINITNKGLHGRRLRTVSQGDIAKLKVVGKNLESTEIEELCKSVFSTELQNLDVVDYELLLSIIKAVGTRLGEEEGEPKKKDEKKSTS